MVIALNLADSFLQKTNEKELVVAESQHYMIMSFNRFS